MSDFTATDACKLKIVKELNWDDFRELKETIQRFATKQNYLTIDLEDYCDQFSIDEVTKFLESKGFRVQHNRISSWGFCKNIQIYNNSTVSW